MYHINHTLLDNDNSVNVYLNPALSETEASRLSEKILSEHLFKVLNLVLESSND